jgi:uncharacterized protein YdeI (YjbR/CyaY-like superfamily)
MAKAAKPTRAGKCFVATLERMRSRLNWTVIHIPFDAAAVWGLRGQIKVKGKINGFAFRTSLFPSREGGHILLVNKRMQKGARAVAGGAARFELEFDAEKRTATIPDELQRILGQDRSLRCWYDRLIQSTRNDIAKWITEVKSTEARFRRAEQIAERLLAVMEAERELPPLLQIPFARQPRAREGWEAMSASRRRAHLFAIFYYRSPEARGRRVDKMLEDASAVAAKKSNRD